MTGAAMLAAVLAWQEGGSGLFDGFDPPPADVYDNPPAVRVESGSGFGNDAIRELNRAFGKNGSGAVPVESGSGPFGGLPDPFLAPEPAPRVRAPPPRRDPPPAPTNRPPALPGGGFDAADLPPPAVPTEADAAPPPGDARVHALLVSLGWIAALAAGGLAGYLLGVGRGEERRRRSLEPRQLDLAGEIAETADSLLAAAERGEADRYGACVDRLRERVGRTAVLLDDRAADAVRGLVAAAGAAPPTGEAGKLEAAYRGLLGTLRRSVRGGPS